MRTDRAITRISGERVPMGSIVNRMTRMKTFPSLVVGNNSKEPKMLNFGVYPHLVISYIYFVTGQLTDLD